MNPPFDKFVRSSTNPLGVDAEHFSNVDEPIMSHVQVLEYKYSLDALIQELDNGQKNAHEIGLAVCWELGERWQASFDILSFLDEENVHHREFHGVTHQLFHGASRLPAFQVIAPPMRLLPSGLALQPKVGDLSFSPSSLLPVTGAGRSGTLSPSILSLS